MNELNRVQSELTELRVQHRNQSQALEVAEETIRELTAQLNEVQALADETEERQMSSAVDSHELQSRVDVQQATIEALKDEVGSLQRSLELNQEDARAQNAAYTELQSRFETVSAEAADARHAATTAEHKVVELTKRLDASNEKLVSTQEELGSLSAQAKAIAQLVAAKEAAERRVAYVDERLRRLVSTSTQREHALQNDLQATRQLLEELKLEYEEFSEVARLRSEAEKAQLRTAHLQLQEDFEKHKLREAEATNFFVTEQREIVRALQEQFDEYRRTAEELLVTEAEKLEEKTHSQMVQYEQELVNLVKLKDQQFLEMVTAKDAKIMSLIEGTDVQRVMLRHEAELDQLKKQHVRDVEMVKEIIQSEQRKLIVQLQHSVEVKDQRLDASRAEVQQWRKRVEEARLETEQQAEEAAAKEKAQLQLLEKNQAQLGEAYARIEALMQVRENLRHKILRLRLQLEGKADDTVESMLRRLTIETTKLAGEFTDVSRTYEDESKRAHDLGTRLQHALRARDRMRAELARRTKEFRNLSSAFEAFVLHRSGASGSGGGQELLEQLRETRTRHEDVDRDDGFTASGGAADDDDDERAALRVAAAAAVDDEELDEDRRTRQPERSLTLESLREPHDLDRSASMHSVASLHRAAEEAKAKEAADDEETAAAAAAVEKSSGGGGDDRRKRPQVHSAPKLFEHGLASDEQRRRAVYDRLPNKKSNTRTDDEDDDDKKRTSKKKKNRKSLPKPPSGRRPTNAAGRPVRKTTTTNNSGGGGGGGLDLSIAGTSKKG